MSRFNLALRLLWRDSRSGELTLLILALLIAVSSSTAIALFSERLQRTMSHQAAELLGADLVIASPEVIAPQWLEQAKQLNCQSPTRHRRRSCGSVVKEDLLIAR